MIFGNDYDDFISFLLVKPKPQVHPEPTNLSQTHPKPGISPCRLIGISLEPV